MHELYRFVRTKARRKRNGRKQPLLMSPCFLCPKKNGLQARRKKELRLELKQIVPPFKSGDQNVSV